jgi:hypothetical protein
MALQRRGGVIQLKVGGVTYDCAGQFSFNLGAPKREAIMGPDGIHGYKELPQVGYIEGEITDANGLSLTNLANVTGTPVSLTLANGKTVSIGSAFYAAEGTGQTESGNYQVRFEGDAQEIS